MLEVLNNLICERWKSLGYTTAKSTNRIPASIKKQENKNIKGNYTKSVEPTIKQKY